MIDIKELTLLQKKLTTKENMLIVLKERGLSTPDKLIEFYVGVGGYVSKSNKRVMTSLFRKEFNFSLEDIKLARQRNPQLKALGNMRTKKRYKEGVKSTSEFASRRRKVFTNDEKKLFVKLRKKGLSRVEIAEKMKRTYSSIEYLHKTVELTK